MSINHRYPRGYLTVSSIKTTDTVTAGKPVVMDVPCDTIIHKLYLEYIERRGSPYSWDFQSRVIERCSQLFGDFDQWLKLQYATNNSLYDMNLDFITDTIRFIRGETREMSVLTWDTLLIENAQPSPGIANLARYNKLGISSGEFTNAIPNWCSREGGFSDMLCTAHVLFGITKMQDSR